MPRLRAALNGSNEARVVFETHAVTGAQDAKAVRAGLALLGGTREAADILPALRLVVVAIGVTQAAARGIRRAVLVVAAIEQSRLIAVLVTPVIVQDGDGATIVK